MSQHRHPGAPGRTGAVPALPDLPEATVARLPEYLRALHQLADAGHETVSSEGLANAAIAERLGLSEKTVRNHVSNILAKLQVADRA